MRYVICYDVSENKIRYRLAKYLEKLAYRIQGSVFMCELDSIQILAVKHTVEKMLKGADNPSFVICPLCDSCQKKYWQYGTTKEQSMPTCLVI